VRHPDTVVAPARLWSAVIKYVTRAIGCQPGAVPDEACAWPDDDNPDSWGDLFECLFQGHDALLLYDMPASSAESVIDGVNLHPSQWVAEFGLPIWVPERPDSSDDPADSGNR
jgi:hypothetical protein